MAFTLSLATEMETQVREAAARKGLEPEQYVLEAVAERLERDRQANAPSLFQDFEAGYQAKAAEERRQAEALEWAEGMRSCAD